MPADDRIQVEAVTRRFVDAWLTRPASARTVKLAGVASADFAPQVVQIPDDVLPVGTLEGLDDTRTDGQQASVVGHLTTGQRFSVGLTLTADGWRVTALDEA